MKVIAIASISFFIGTLDLSRLEHHNVYHPVSQIISMQERVEIDLKDVPEKVRTSIGDGTELGWKIFRAYLITNDDKTQYYELYVRKMEEETVMKVDKNGQVLN